MQFADNDRNFLFPHAQLEVNDMTWGGIDAWAQLNRADRFHAKPCGEIDYIWMVADQLYAAEWCRLLFPADDCSLEFCEVGGKILLKGGGVLRVVEAQSIGDRTDHVFPRHRV